MNKHNKKLSGRKIQFNRLPGRIRRRQIDTLNTDRLRAKLRRNCLETLVALREAQDARRWRLGGDAA